MGSKSKMGGEKAVANELLNLIGPHWRSQRRLSKEEILVVDTD
jgi:hypothetical protein